MATPKEMIDVIDKHIAGTNEEIAMMVPCHFNTLVRIRSGQNNIRHQLFLNIEKLYVKALKVEKLMEK